jgi:hypothetical protein
MLSYKRLELPLPPTRWLPQLPLRQLKQASAAR